MPLDESNFGSKARFREDLPIGFPTDPSPRALAYAIRRLFDEAIKDLGLLRQAAGSGDLDSQRVHQLHLDVESLAYALCTGYDSCVQQLIQKLTHKETT